MVSCPKCDGNLDIEEDELDEGDVVSCDECGASLHVAGLNPLDIQSEDEIEEEDEDDFLDDDDDDEDEDDEDEDEDY